MASWLDPETQSSSSSSCVYLCFHLHSRWDSILQRIPPAMMCSIIKFCLISSGFITQGITSTNLSTLEKRYDFSSSSAAWIASSHEIGAAIFAILFGYLGINIHKGRLLAISAICMTLGCIVMSLPHFSVGPYHAGPASTPPPAADVSGMNRIWRTPYIPQDPRLWKLMKKSEKYYYSADYGLDSFEHFSFVSVLVENLESLESWIRWGIL